MSTLTKIVSLRASAAITSATTENGTASKLDTKYSELVVILNVTAAATEVDDTLDVYVDTSFDGGSTWVNIGHFTQVLGNGGAKKYIMAFKANPITASNSVLATADQAAAAALQIGFGDKLRYRGVTVDPSGSNISFTYAVDAYLQ